MKSQIIVSFNVTTKMPLNLGLLALILPLDCSLHFLFFLTWHLIFDHFYTNGGRSAVIALFIKPTVEWKWQLHLCSIKVTFIPDYFGWPPIQKQPYTIMSVSVYFTAFSRNSITDLCSSRFFQCDCCNRLLSNSARWHVLKYLQNTQQSMSYSVWNTAVSAT